MTHKTKKIISYILYVHRSRPQELTQHFILWLGNKERKEKTMPAKKAAKKAPAKKAPAKKAAKKAAKKK